MTTASNVSLSKSLSLLGYVTVASNTRAHSSLLFVRFSVQLAHTRPFNGIFGRTVLLISVETTCNSIPEAYALVIGYFPLNKV